MGKTENTENTESTENVDSNEVDSTEGNDNTDSTDTKKDLNKSDEKSKAADEDVTVKVQKAVETTVSKLLENLDKSKALSYTEVVELVKNAGKEGYTTSKNQLYNEITKLKAEVKKLSTPKTDNEKEILAAKVGILEDKLVELSETLVNVKKESETDKLEAHKAKVIAANKGLIVESLVKGNTIEEINASLKVAKEERTKIEEELKSKIKLPKGVSFEDVLATESSDDTDDDVSEPVVVNVKDRASVNEFRKNKAKILEDVYKANGLYKK